MEWTHELAAWIGLAVSMFGGIYYLARQIDSKLTSKDYTENHRDLEERVRRLELWASKKSFDGYDHSGR